MVKKNIKMGKLPLDVRSSTTIPAFENMLSKGPMTIILVYADWCGHCDTFKKNIWKPLNSTPNRTMNMASVHYDQLENTSLKNSAINGYPSLLVVGTDKEPATFESDSGTTNAMPNANDIDTMKKIITTPVSSMKPKENSAPVMNESMTFAYENSSNTMPLSQGSPMRNSASPMRNVASQMTNVANEMTNVGNQLTTATPPNTSDDVIENMYEANVNSVPTINTRSRRRAYNNANTYEEDSEDSGIPVNTIPTNTQGTTPILTGGRLYRSLTTKNRKKTKSKKSRRKK